MHSRMVQGCQASERARWETERDEAIQGFNKFYIEANYVAEIEMHQ